MYSPSRNITRQGLFREDHTVTMRRALSGPSLVSYDTYPVLVLPHESLTMLGARVTPVLDLTQSTHYAHLQRRLQMSSIGPFSFNRLGQQIKRLPGFPESEV